MHGFLIVIPADAKSMTEATITELTDTPELETVKAGLNGGDLQLVPFLNIFGDADCIAYVDESGKYKNLPLNQVGTLLWEIALGHSPLPDDWISGPLVIIGGDKEMIASL